MHSVSGLVLAMIHESGRGSDANRDESDSRELIVPSAYTDIGKLSLNEVIVTNSRGMDTTKDFFFFNRRFRSSSLRRLNLNFLPPIFQNL